MPALNWTPHRRSTLPLLFPVLALHMALLTGLLRLGVWPERGQPASRTPLSVQLSWQRWVGPEAATPRPVLPRPPTPRPAPIRPAAKARAVPALPAAAAGEAVLQVITPPAPASAPGGATTAPPSAAPPLDLSLPRGASAAWRQRPQALDDPRSNTPKLTLEQRLAMTMGGDLGGWEEEIIDADHRRLRRGNMCVYIQRSAASQLDPFHPAFRNLPWQVGSPTRC